MTGSETSNFAMHRVMPECYWAVSQSTTEVQGFNERTVSRGTETLTKT